MGREFEDWGNLERMERTRGGVEIESFESKSLERVVQTALRGVGTSTVTQDG